MSLPRLRWMLALGLITEIIYLLAFLWPFPLLGHYTVDTDMAGIMDHRGFGFGLFVGAFVLLFLFLGVAVRLCSPQPPGSEHRAAWLKTVLLFSAIFGLTLAFVYPVTAIDLFNYVAESRILVQYDQNPIFVPPAAFPRDPVMSLSGAWAASGAPYGPLGILVDAWPAVIAPASLLANLLLLKASFALLVVVETWLVYRILESVNESLALSGAILVGWSPLLLFETAANGHNDIVMLVLATAGLLALVESRMAIGIVLLTASALVKYATLPLLPLALIYVASRRLPAGRKAFELGMGAAVSILLAVVLYAPFWEGTATLDRTLIENSFHLQSFGALVAWAWPGVAINTATAIGRAFFVPVYLYACWLATRRPVDMLKGMGLATLGFLALAAGNVKIWYLSWPVVFSALDGWPARVGVAACSLGATLSAASYAYVFIWLGATGDDFATVNATAYLMAFLPAAILLAPAVQLAWKKYASVLGPPVALSSDGKPRPASRT